jgi:hypothetical protein
MTDMGKEKDALRADTGAATNFTQRNRVGPPRQSAGMKPRPGDLTEAAKPPPDNPPATRIQKNGQPRPAAQHGPSLSGQGQFTPAGRNRAVAGGNAPRRRYHDERVHPMKNGVMKKNRRKGNPA